MNRRQFIEATALTGIGACAFPNILCSNPAVERKLNIACIGVGGKGTTDIQKVQGENVIALCDVDSGEPMQKAKELFPEAKTYSDFRVMLRELHHEIDAVTISTPDHTHFPIAMMALKLGKHVYVQKPLAHSVWEVRQLMAEARKQGVVTQMGNQGHAFEGIRLIREWYEAGLIGEVKEVISWTNRPAKGWGFIPEQMDYPSPEPVPSNLNWDVWQGPVKDIPGYASNVYHPMHWRGWWQFGVGGLGDIGCHTIDSPFWALDLEIPKRVDVEIDHLNTIFTPSGSIVKFTFPQKSTGKEIPLTWYEGPQTPKLPASLDGVELNKEGGLAIVGTDGVIYHQGMRPNSPRLYPEEKWQEFRTNPASRPPKKYPRIKGNHVAEWLRAIKGTGPTPGSNFEYAGRLTESILLGSLAIRTGKGFNYDEQSMRILDNQDANGLLKTEARKGFRVQDLVI